MTRFAVDSDVNRVTLQVDADQESTLRLEKPASGNGAEIKKKLRNV